MVYRYHPDSDGRMKSKQSRDTPTLLFYFGIAAPYARAASSFRDGVENQGICFLVYATVTGLEAKKEMLMHDQWPQEAERLARIPQPRLPFATATNTLRSRV